MSTKVTVTALPPCDLHNGAHSAQYDIKLPTYGTWANVCEAGYRQFGSPELGTGLGQRLVLTRPKLATFEEALDALRHFVQDLGNYTEGSPAQRQQVEIWWPLFKREFEAHGLKFDQ